jgi:uncharacterized protein YbjT (DUF2867 family)
MADKRRLLVVGGTGTIGGHLMTLLQADRAELDIVAAARSDRSRQALEAQGFATVRMDLDDHRSIPPALDGVDVVFTLKDYSIAFLIHAKRLIDAAEQAGVSHYVDVSSMAPRDLPYAPMGWNRLCDAYLKMSVLGHTILHPNLFMDNILRFIDRDNRVIRHLIGDFPAGWIAAKDIARVAAAVIRKPSLYRGQTIPLATDRRTFPEVMGLIKEITGRDYRFERTEPEAALAAMLKNGADREQAAPLVDYFHKISKGEVPYFTDLADPMAGITGAPATLWPDFIRDNAAAF